MDYNPDCPAWGNLTWPKVGEFNLANGGPKRTAPYAVPLTSKSCSLLCDGEQWRVSPGLLRKIIDL